MDERWDAAFDAMVSALDSALESLGELPVRENPAFSVDPGWFPETLHVNVVKPGAAPLIFMAEPDWARVDVGACCEALELPLREMTSRWRKQRFQPFSEVAPRLLTSSVTVSNRRRSQVLFMTDAEGESWCRNTYLLSQDFEIPSGATEVTFDPLCRSLP